MKPEGRLKPLLVRLKLSGMLQSLDERLHEAKSQSWSYSDFLHMILRDEVDRRDEKQLNLRLKRSGLDSSKTLQNYDFTFNRSVGEKAVREIVDNDFVLSAENILILGPSGTGKSHLAQALAFEAVRNGYDALFKRTDHLLLWLNSGRGDNSYQRRMNQISKLPVLVLDDFGLKPLTAQEQVDLYDLISERYDKTSTIITSNRSFNEWSGVFKDPLMASAVMDRLVHKAIKLTITGKSFRTETFLKRQKKLTQEVN